MSQQQSTACRDTLNFLFVKKRRTIQCPSRARTSWRNTSPRVWPPIRSSPVKWISKRPVRRPPKDKKARIEVEVKHVAREECERWVSLEKHDEVWFLVRDLQNLHDCTVSFTLWSRLVRIIRVRPIQRMYGTIRGQKIIRKAVQIIETSISLWLMHLPHVPNCKASL